MKNRIWTLVSAFSVVMALSLLWLAIVIRVDYTTAPETVWETYEISDDGSLELVSTYVTKDMRGTRTERFYESLEREGFVTYEWVMVG